MYINKLSAAVYTMESGQSCVYTLQVNFNMVCGIQTFVTIRTVIRIDTRMSLQMALVANSTGEGRVTAMMSALKTATNECLQQERDMLESGHREACFHFM